MSVTVTAASRHNDRITDFREMQRRFEVMRSIAIALFAAAAASRGRGRRGKKSTATLEMPGASVCRVAKRPLSQPAPGALPPLTLETIELDDLVTVPDVVW
jgi:hypothetical protein